MHSFPQEREIYVLCLHVCRYVSHLISQGFSFPTCKMGTMEQWSKPHSPFFIFLETWKCGPELIFMADIY